MKDINVRDKTTKLLEHTSINLYHFGLSNSFLGMPIKTQPTKENIKTSSKWKSLCIKRHYGESE